MAGRALKAGRRGEQLAAGLLQQDGYRILAANHHSRYGEVDLIAAGEDCIVFVEVKLRRDGSMVSGEEAVSLTKRRKIIKTALLYLQEHPSRLQPRFDVISIVTGKDGGLLRWEHYKGAFDGDGYGA